MRNACAAASSSSAPDDVRRALIGLDGARVVAHITRDAVAALSLRPGAEVWALVKAVSLRSHAFPAE